MHKYEATFILSPSGEALEAGKTVLKSEFSKSDVKVLKEEDKGQQELSYPIRKNNRGHYLYFELEAPPDSISAIEKNLKIQPEILKYLFIRVA
ncbi:MAG: 30S ribosomal protein S6 [Spirochaetales bacterium]|nr:30S ribosomal protein S6 [Spirochaetales bacterium]